MVNATTVKVRSIFVMLCLSFSQFTVADNDRGRHWSEGIYFPPQTVPQQQTRDTYGPRFEPDRQPSPPSPGKSTKYNPWSLQRRGNDTRRPPSLESMGYPSQDYDPYRTTDRRRQTAPVEEEPYPPHPGDFAAAEYYSGQSRYESDRSAPRSEYPPRDYGRRYDSRPYTPGYGSESYFPYYGAANYPWTGLNPFFMYGVGSPYLPDWW